MSMFFKHSAIYQSTKRASQSDFDHHHRHNYNKEQNLSLQDSHIISYTMKDRIQQSQLAKDKFHIVQNLLLYTDPNFKESVDRSPEKSKLRQKELDDTLQANLNHPQVGSIHIMYTNPLLPIHIDGLALVNRHKLILQHFNSTPFISHFLQYIEKNLQDQNVIVSNQDIELGEGWDKIDLDKFRDQKLMYALTRHAKSEHVQQKHCYGAHMANCNPGSKDHGSVDLFTFYFKGKVPEQMVREMTYTQAKYGMENVFIWYARNKWGYHVLNPCRVIVTYHIDCYHIDERGRSRQKSGHIGIASMSNRLYKN